MTCRLSSTLQFCIRKYLIIKPFTDFYTFLFGISNDFH